MEGRWECSMRAIQLIQAYITQFPRLFQALNRTPQTDRFFKMDTLFAGADAAEKKAALTEVVDWLGGLEVMRLARAPLTTEALGSNAVKAIQKAADVRNAKLAQLAASGGPPGGDDSAVVGNESAGWPPLEVVAGVAPDELVLEPTPDISTCWAAISTACTKYLIVPPHVHVGDNSPTQLSSLPPFQDPLVRALDDERVSLCRLQLYAQCRDKINVRCRKFQCHRTMLVAKKAVHVVTASLHWGDVVHCIDARW